MLPNLLFQTQTFRKNPIYCRARWRSHLPPDGLDTATVVQRCREQDLFLRDAALGGLGRFIVDGIAQIKVRSDDPIATATAAEMFLSRSGHM